MDVLMYWCIGWWMDGWICWCIGWWMDGCVDMLMYWLIDVSMDGWMCWCIDRCIDVQFLGDWCSMSLLLLWTGRRVRTCWRWRAWHPPGLFLWGCCRVGSRPYSRVSLAPAGSLEEGGVKGGGDGSRLLNNSPHHRTCKKPPSRGSFGGASGWGLSPESLTDPSDLKVGVQWGPSGEELLEVDSGDLSAAVTSTPDRQTFSFVVGCSVVSSHWISFKMDSLCFKPSNTFLKCVF